MFYCVLLLFFVDVVADLFEFVTRKYIANVEGGGETLCVYQDVLVSVLSLVDALLYDTPTHCPAMIYAMLSKRELVSALVSVHLSTATFASITIFVCCSIRN